MPTTNSPKRNRNEEPKPAPQAEQDTNSDSAPDEWEPYAGPDGTLITDDPETW